MSKSNKIVRLKLSDFLDTEREKDVMYFLKFIFQSIDSKKLHLHLWYYSNEISNKELTDFKKAYSVFLKKNDVQIYEMKGKPIFVWYEIINQYDSDKVIENKFKYVYMSLDGIITAIADFNSFYKSSITYKQALQPQKNRKGRFK